MPRTFFSIASLTTACLAAACFAPPVLAQGALKPVEALIVNPTNRPVPVTVITPPAAPQPATVTCRIRLAASNNGTPFFAAALAGPTQVLECPNGVTKLDVHRVMFDPRGGLRGSDNVAHFNVMVGLGPTPTQGPSDEDFATTLAMLTDGAPDLSLARPVRVDKSAAGVSILIRIGCTSGIAGIVPTCAGVIFVVGTPVN